MGSRWSLPSSWSLDSYSDDKSKRWTNADMEPVPVHLRTWTTWNYVAYWFSDAFAPATWELASTMIAVGLSWKQSLLVILCGNVILASVILANGTIVRASFGFWFSYFAVFCRVLVSIFWFGVQTYIGSECTYQMLKALIGPPFLRIPNHLPASAGITTTGMLSFLLFWLIELPFLFVSPPNIRHLFAVKAVVVPMTCLGILIWAVVRVPPHTSLRYGSLRGARTSNWVVLSALNSAIASWSSMAVNIADFTRYSRNERACDYLGVCGVMVASTTEVLYGEIIWDPLQVIDRWDSRVASFLAAFSFALAVLGTNVGANSLSAANDMTVLWPRYINIRRGQVICGILGAWMMCPWKVLASAPGFLAILSSYCIFMAPIAAMYVALQYFIVHRCKVDVQQLYDPEGRYKYWNGINWRAAAAFIIGFGPTLPGLIAHLNSSVVVGSAGHIFDFGWIYASISSGFVFGVISAVFPPYETF
ncbi:permease for cytosine/purines, uracil, thiamine, allantoin-domain-containing protein [Mycena amicta]|nr:permease for cytosine/purines, uracil, thiamine, allantoin-domain-containing protein [Mycena amicta]